jgi:hypothetical protein
MVSEAASSGKETVVFDLLRKKESSKHEYAINRLNELGYIVRTPVENIGETVSGVLTDKRPVKKLDNAGIMYEKLYRII